MGYNVDEAARYAEEDRINKEAEAESQGLNSAATSQGKGKAMKTTTEEQEALLQKLQAINENTK